MKKQNKQCESCQQFGKGTCNAFKCIVRNYCNWKEIKRQKITKEKVKKLINLIK